MTSLSQRPSSNWEVGTQKEGSRMVPVFDAPVLLSQVRCGIGPGFEAKGQGPQT